MLIYKTKHSIFIHENTIKQLPTRMFPDFAGLDKEIIRWQTKMAKKDPSADIVMVFNSASNIGFNGKPSYANTAERTLILYATYTFVDVKSEPIYLVESMKTIEMQGQTYTKFDTYLSSDTYITKTFWSHGGSIITDQGLIEDLEWNKIT